jgi:hypothetical protein
VAVICDTLSDIFKTDVEVENGGDTNWAEEAHKPGLFEMLNLVDLLMHGHYDWDPSEEENTNAQKDKTPKWNDTVMGE